MAMVQDLITESAVAHELTVRHRGVLRTTIQAAGELDLAAREDLALALQARTRRRGIVELDLSGATFLDCSCLGVIVAAHHRLLELHGRLVITGVEDFIARTIRLTGLDNTLFIVPADQDSFSSALAARSIRRPRVPFQQPPRS